MQTPKAEQQGFLSKQKSPCNIVWVWPNEQERLPEQLEEKYNYSQNLRK